MQHDGDIGTALDRRFHQLDQIGVVRIGARTLRDLKDHRGVLLLTGLGDALHDLHIVDIERADGIAVVIGLFKHFLRGNEWHRIVSFYQLFQMIGTFGIYCIVAHGKINARGNFDFISKKRDKGAALSLFSAQRPALTAAAI